MSNSVDALHRIYNLINTAIIEGKIILRAVALLFVHKAPLYFPSFFLNGREIDGRGWRFNEIFEALPLTASHLNGISLTLHSLLGKVLLIYLCWWSTLKVQGFM